MRDEFEDQKLDKLVLSYIFRFHSGQFILLCWDKTIDDETLNKNNVLLNYQYPYTLLDNLNTAVLSRCTSEVTYHHIYLIDVTWGQSMFDDITNMRNYADPEAKVAFDEMTRQ